MRKTILALITSAMLILPLAQSAEAAPVTTVEQTAPVTISFPIAEAVPAALQPAFVIPMGTYFGNGNYWYTTVVNSAIMGNIRFSWSHMWYIKTHYAGAASMASLLCGAVPSSAGRTACYALAAASAAYIMYRVNTAISHRKCLTVRFALPPWPYYANSKMWEVTCTR